MEQLFRVLLLIAMVAVIGIYISDKLETDYSSFVIEKKEEAKNIQEDNICYL